MNTQADFDADGERQQRADRQRAVLAALQPLLPAHALLYTLEDTIP